MKTLVVFKAPELRPLPSEATPALIREAVLPVKIAAMSRAIANCTDLPELLNYKRNIEGIAAAARTLKKEIPEAVGGLNRVAKETIFRLGVLLLTYNGSTATPGVRGSIRSERHKVAIKLGIPSSLVGASTRLAAAPKKVQDQLLYNEAISPCAESMSRHAPRVSNKGRVSRSGDLGSIMKGNSGCGLVPVFYLLKRIPMDAFSKLETDERKVVRAKISEIMELLDEMDQRCDRP